MRAFALPLFLAAMAVMPVAVQAELLVGLATENGLKGINIEGTGKAGSAYVVLGTYQSATGFQPRHITGVLGLRRFQGNKFDEDGYFAGVFAGDIDGGPNRHRYGGGGEVGYQWLTDHLRLTLEAGMALAGAPSTGAPPGSTAISPVPLLAASISFRF